MAVITAKLQFKKKYVKTFDRFFKKPCNLEVKTGFFLAYFK
jgi:hypothetical protein